MALLVGVSDTTGYTDTTVSYGGNNYAYWYSVTSTSAGTATALYLYLSSFYSATVAKLCIWSSTGTLLRSTSAISTGAPGWISGAISDLTIEAATTYRLGFISDNYIRPYCDATTYQVYNELDSYTTPGDVGAGTAQAKGKYPIYADGTIGGGDVEITSEVGALTIAGQTPTLAMHWYSNPDVGALTLEGFAPTFIERGSRYAYPTADVTAGTWQASTGSDLYAMIDEETASDTDYIYTNAAGACEIRLLPVTDPVSSSGYALNYRIWSPVGGNAVVRLKQGATTIATWTHTGLPTTATDYSQSLSGAEADSITDHDDLRIEIEAT